MIQGKSSDFFILNLNTATPSYFWRGVELLGVTRVFVHPRSKSVTLRVSDLTVQPELVADMRAAGIKILLGVA